MSEFECRKFIRKSRVTWWASFAVTLMFSIIFWAVILPLLDDDSKVVFGIISFYLLPTCFIVFLIFAICSFQLKCVNYTFEGNKICVYAGWNTSRLFINDKLVDEYICSMSFAPISLNYQSKDDTKYEVTIALGNHVHLKINGELCIPDRNQAPYDNGITK